MTGADTQVQVQGKRKTKVGRVVSDRMDKTIVVSVERLARHPLYKRVIRLSTKFKAHDEENEARIGDTVLQHKLLETALSRSDIDAGWRGQFLGLHAKQLVQRGDLAPVGGLREDADPHGPLALGEKRVEHLEHRDGDVR